MIMNKQKQIQQLTKQLDEKHTENKELLKHISNGCHIIDATAYPDVQQLAAAIDSETALGYKVVTTLNSLLIFMKDDTTGN